MKDHSDARAGVVIKQLLQALPEEVLREEAALQCWLHALRKIEDQGYVDPARLQEWGWERRFSFSDGRPRATAVGGC